MTKYFLYARKSTDSEDKQVLSIEGQLAELRQFARREELSVRDELFEAKTAKEPGRAVFNEMVQRIERGQANAILAWHPDRLARNSMDGGKIIYLTDTEKLVDLRFPTYRFENTAQGKFMLSIIFGQSKYFVDNLSENVLRGFRQKLRRGEYPGYAPLGYKNNLLNHAIELVPEVAEKVKQMFEAYATGRYSLEEVRKLATASGLASRRKHAKLGKSNIERLLKNPFYYGAFRFKGELYEGIHPPIIGKELFDQVQFTFALRSKPRINGPHYHVFRGLLKCGRCGCSITSEIQKQRYIYYHCTRKRGNCSEPYMREEALIEKINQAIDKVAISEGLKQFFFRKIDEEFSRGSSSPSPALAINTRLGEIERKLNILLEAYISELISEEEYKCKKSALLNEKLELKEKLPQYQGKGEVRFELMRNFVSSAGQASYIIQEGTLEEKREYLQKIGSNFRLADAKLLFSYKLPYKLLLKNGRTKKWGG